MIANAKFPEGTASGMYKAAVFAQPNRDIMRVDSQRINWTLKELDVSLRDGKRLTCGFIDSDTALPLRLA